MADANKADEQVAAISCDSGCAGGLAASGDPARVDDLIVLGENAANRGGMDLEQAGRPRTRLVTLRHLSSYCAQLSSWASPMRSPSGPRM
jgi:hypothetical protein